MNPYFTSESYSNRKEITSSLLQVRGQGLREKCNKSLTIKVKNILLVTYKLKL